MNNKTRDEVYTLQNFIETNKYNFWKDKLITRPDKYWWIFDEKYRLEHGWYEGLKYCMDGPKGYKGDGEHTVGGCFSIDFNKAVKLTYLNLYKTCEKHPASIYDELNYMYIEDIRFAQMLLSKTGYK